MDIFKLYRDFWDYSFENTGDIKPNHIAIFCFAIEHCNRLGWKTKFGLPTAMVMEATGIKSYNTYIDAFNDLVKFGFIKLIEKSKNQYSSNIIALSNFDKALYKALDRALIKHTTKQHESTVQSTSESTSSIIIPIYNNTNIQDTNTQTPLAFNFSDALILLGAEKNYVDEWLKIRKLKKALNSETGFKGFKRELEISNKAINEVLIICIENSWSGFKNEWLTNLKFGAKEEATKYPTKYLNEKS